MTDLPAHRQALYHAGCALRHVGKAVSALWCCQAVRIATPILAALVMLHLFAGCHGALIHPAPAVSVGQSADSTRKQERERIADRDSQSVAAVSAWLAHIPQITPEAWRSEFALFLARYRDVSPRVDHVTAATARVSAWADGRTEDAKAQTAVAMVDAKTFVAQLAVETAARISAEAKEAQSRAESERQIAALKAENSKLEDSIWQRVRFWSSLGLYGAAAACLLLAGLRIKAAIATGLDLIGAVKSAATWTGFAAALFSLSRILSAWWFWYACAGVIVLALAYVAFLVWREQHGTAAARTLAPVVSALDHVYDSASGTAKDDLDARIFEHLSDAMKDVPGAKAFIHKIRADMKAGASVK